MAAHLTVESPEQAYLIECGSSQGLWALPWIYALGKARAKQSLNPSVRKVKATAIEASSSQTEAKAFWGAQDLRFKVTQSGTDLKFRSNNWEVDWIQRAVVAKDGPVYFPVVTVDADNGAQATSETGDRDIRGKEVEYQRVEGVRLATLIAQHEHVNFLHLDVQGTELEMLQNGEFEILRGRVGVILLGTHSRAAEDAAFRLLPTLGFTLIAEESCRYSRPAQSGDLAEGEDTGTLALTVDGEQFWVSASVLRAGRDAGFLKV